MVNKFVRPALLGAAVLAAGTARAQNKAAAWAFIKFLSTHKDRQIEAFRGYDAFPALLEAQNDPFVDQPIEYLGGQKARQQWKVAVSNTALADAQVQLMRRVRR